MSWYLGVSFMNLVISIWANEWSTWKQSTFFKLITVIQFSTFKKDSLRTINYYHLVDNVKFKCYLTIITNFNLMNI